MLRRAVFSLIGGALLVWSLVFLGFALAAPHGLRFPELVTTARFRVGSAIIDALLWPSFLFMRWQVPNPELTSGPPVSPGLPLWFFDVPLAALFLFAVLSLRAARGRAVPTKPDAA
jgi:hypothetical protein